MADRGFEIQDLSAPREAGLPFMRSKDQDEQDETRDIASVGIHVERAIERVKNCTFLNRYSTYPLIRTYFFRFSLNGFLCKWCLVEF